MNVGRHSHYNIEIKIIIRSYKSIIQDNLICQTANFHSEVLFQLITK